MRRKIFSTLLATLVCTLALQAKGPQNSGERIYIYGCAASFLDSVVYITDIQPVDSAVLSKKTGFLMGRQLYSEQLHTYLQQQEGMNQMTCAVYFDKKPGRIKKKYQKMLKDYQSQQHLSVKTLQKDAFAFTSAEWIESTIEDADAAPQTPDAKGAGKPHGKRARKKQ